MVRSRRKLRSELLEDRRMLFATVFEDNFESGNLGKWNSIGSPVVMLESETGGPINAGGIRALNLDSGTQFPNGIPAIPINDMVETVLDLSSYSAAQLRYRVQAEGKGYEPAAGDDLIVEYAAPGLSTYQTLRTDSNAGTNNASFNTRYVDLPATALQNQFRLRFRNLGDLAISSVPTQGRDDWFIDDVVVWAWRPDITISDASATEGGVATFTVSLSENTPVPITVNYAVANGTASSADFVQPTTSSITIPANTRNATISVQTTADQIDELNEEFSITLQTASNRFTISDSVGIGTIIDNNPLPNVSIAIAGASAGDSGQVTEGGDLTLNVTLDRPSSREVAVNYATVLDTASSDDVISQSGTLTFASGQTEKQVTISTNEDNIDELLESFRIELFDPSNAALGQFSTASISIIDNDDAPVLSIASASILEGDASSSPLTFDLTLSNPSSTPITVDYASAGLSAEAGEDFVSASGTLTFPPGSMSQSLSVGLIPDDKDEGAEEQFQVLLTNPSANTVLGNSIGVGTILDNDATPIARTDSNSYAADEGTGGFLDGFQIDASQSSDSDSNALVYSWDLGNDGSFDRITDSPFEYFSHSDLTAVGLGEGTTNTQIRLNVSDGANSDEIVVALDILNSQPQILNTYDAPVTLAPESGGWFQTTILTDDLSLTESHGLTVDYGDGTTWEQITGDAGVRSFPISHQYAASGSYDVQINVGDGEDFSAINFSIDVSLGSALPEVNFSSASQSSTEGEQLFATATLASPSTDTVIVPLTSGGSATEFLDFTFVTEFFEFQPGETEATVEILVPVDGIREPSENFQLIMQEPVGAQLGSTTTHEVALADGDLEPDVNFASAFVSLQEGATGTLTVTLANPTATEVVVPLSFSGSATEGTHDNFLFPGDEIRIPAGAISATKSLYIVDDVIAESSQTLFISMGLPTGALPGPDATATVLIPANDTPIVDFRSASILADESSGTSNVVVDLSNPIPTSVSVPFTISGTAEDGSDFSYSPDSPLVFAANQTSSAIDLTVIDDLLVEPGAFESVVIEFGEPDVGILGNTRIFELRIVDNDRQTIQFVLDRQEVDEDIGQATFLVQANRVADVDISIPVSVVLDTSEPNDFAAVVPTEVILPSGQSETSFSIAIANDAENETQESFTVFLGTPSGGGQLGAKDYQQVSIRDDDPIAIISVAEDSFDETARSVDFKVQLTAATNKDVTVNFETFGDATKGQDYTLAPSNFITIPAGQREARIKSIIRADSSVESDETVGLKLTNASNALIKSNLDRASFVLRNNDQAKVRFSTESTDFEEGTTFQVKVRLTKALQEDLTVPVMGVEGSRRAKPGSDYRIQGLGRGNSVSIPAGQREASFSVSIIDDPHFEGSEYIILQLGTPSLPAVELESKLLTFRINANDKYLPRIHYYNLGFGLDESQEIYGPGKLAIDPSQIPKLGPNDILVIENASTGTAIELSSEEVAQFIGSGRLAISTEENGNGIGEGSSIAVAELPFTLAVDEDLGSIQLELIDPARIRGLGDLAVASFDDAPAVGGTINLPLASEQGNLFGSTAFFDANQNGIIDFLDLNGDGIQQFGEPTEPSATTRLDGSFDLSIPTTLDANNDGLFDSRDGRFVLFGGVDTATELPMPLVLEAAMGHFNVSPLSTLAAKLVYDFGNINTVAEQRALSAFGIEGASFSNTQAIASAGAGDFSAARIAIANAQLQATVISIGNLFSPLPHTPTISALGHLVFHDLADKIRVAGSRLDLSSPAQIEAIVSGIEFQLGIQIAAEAKDAATQAISEANARLGAIDIQSSTLLQERAQHEVFFIGQLAPALSQLSAGTLTAAELLSNYAGDPAESAIASAEFGIINPPRVAISSVKTPETDTDGTLRFEVQISGDVTREVEVRYETLLDDAVASEVTPVSGTLKWQPGDNSLRIIEVPFQGDTLFEEDESVLIALTDVTNAVLANDIGVGYILNDDSLTFTAPTENDSNDLELFVDGQDALFFADQQFVFGGFHSGGATSNILGAEGVSDSLSIELGELNSFLAQGLYYEGNNDPGDSLAIENSLARHVIHRSYIDGSGEFETDGRTIAYANVASVSDMLSPSIIGLPDSVFETESVSLTASIPAAFSGATVTWTLTGEGSQSIATEGDGFNHDFEDSGDYELTLALVAQDGRTATRIVPIQVGNLAPVAIGDSANVNEDLSSSIAIAVLANDSDPAGAADLLSIVAVNSADTIGSVTFTETEVTYSPNQQFEWLAMGETATDSFTYTISDGDGGTSIATVTIEISGANDAPLANDVVTNANEDGPSTLINGDYSDHDVTDTHTFDIETTGTLGLVTNNGDGTFTYDPNGAFESLAIDESAVDSFTYIVNDGQYGAPSTDQQQSSNPRFMAAPSVVEVAQSFTPSNNNVSGASVRTFAFGGGITGDLTIALYDALPVNGGVELASGTASNVEDDGSEVFVSWTPVAVEPGVPLFLVFSSTNESGGVLRLGGDLGDLYADGELYISNQVRTDVDLDLAFSTLSVDLSDNIAVGTVTINVSGSNDSPIAQTVNSNANEDGGTVSIVASYSDVDQSDEHIFEVDTSATLGAVTNNGDGTFSYDPTGAFESLAVAELGSDSFTYTVDDQNGGLSTASVVISISGQNDAPIAFDVAKVASEDGGAISLSAVFEDADVSDTHTFEIDTSGTLGLVTQTSTGIFTYDPNGAFETLAVGESAVDSFTYQVNDGNGGTSTATALVTVIGENDVPIANNLAVETNEEGPDLSVSPDFVDADTNDTHTLSVDRSTTLGFAGIDGSGRLFYSPAGVFEYLGSGEVATDTFTYTVDDRNGGRSTATVSVTIVGENDLPVPMLATFSTNENQSGITVSANYFDPDVNDVHTIEIDTTFVTPQGSVSQNGDGTFAYSPNGAFEYLAVGETTTDTIEYTISDGNGGNARGAIQITVNGQNDAPVAVEVTGSISENALPILLAADFNDLDISDTHTFSVDTEATLGRVTNNLNRTFSYDPNGAFEYLAAGETATDSFTYAVNDGNGGIATSSVVVTIVGQNDAPIALDVDGEVSEDGGSIQLAAVYSDPDLTDEHSFAVSQPSHGTVTNQGDGTFDYAPNGAFESLAAGETATDSFSYTVDDGNGGTSTASVVVTIVGQNDAPVAIADAYSLNNTDTGQFAVLSNDFDLDETDNLSLIEGSIVIISSSVELATSAIGQLGNSITFEPNSDFDNLSAGESATVVIGYRVTDDADDALTANGQLTLTILGTNVAPRLESLFSKRQSMERLGGTNTRVVIEGVYSDSDQNDQHQVTIDWGDGSVESADSIDPETGSFRTVHRYAQGGIYTVLATVIDSAGLQDTEEIEVVVTGVGVHDRTLYIVGTSERDDVFVNTKSRGSLIQVDAKLNKGEEQLRVRESFASDLVDEIVVIGGKGDDYLHVANSVLTPTTILAGKGNDLVFGGSGPNAIFGGNGHDWIFGGRANDLLVGGKGRDWIRGGKGDDLLIGGLVDLDLESPSVLSSIDSAMQDWERKDLEATLVSLGGITDDRDEDWLHGQQGTDEIFGGLGDSLRQ